LIETVAETRSTNADLLARLASGERLAEGHWLIALRQTAGRGRQGRDWFDGVGNFMGSTVVHRAETDPPAHSLALVAGMAAYETVLPLCPEPGLLKLKWPNDLLVGGAKLCGILLEAQGSSVVVGIGINLASAPQLPDRATIALSQIAPTPTLESFASQMQKAFDLELERWRSFGLAPLIRRWLAAGTPIGTALTVHEPDGTAVAGSFAGLDDDGNMMLCLEDGSVRAIHAGDVMLG